jgi:hypothetical protein
MGDILRDQLSRVPLPTRWPLRTLSSRSGIQAAERVIRHFPALRGSPLTVVSGGASGRAMCTERDFQMVSTPYPTLGEAGFVHCTY